MVTKLLGLFLLLAFTSNAQMKINFDLFSSFENYKSTEERLGSIEIERKSEYLLSPDLAQPIAYVRPSENFKPQLVVRYFFSKKDSLVQKIEYEWDKQNFRISNYKVTCKDAEDQKKFNDFVEKYTELKNLVTKQFGNGRSEGSLEPRKGVEYLESVTSDSWENDSLSIIMYMTFSNRCDENGTVKYLPAHRIRLYVNSKKTSGADLSNQLKTTFKADSNQQRAAEEYLNLLVNRKYGKSWEFISPSVKATTTYESYLKVVNTIADIPEDYGDKLQLLFSGPKFMNGNVFYSYSYKFFNDQKNPPSIVLDVLFKVGENKIVGFAPRKYLKK